MERDEGGSLQETAWAKAWACAGAGIATSHAINWPAPARPSASARHLCIATFAQEQPRLARTHSESLYFSRVMALVATAHREAAEMHYITLFAPLMQPALTHPLQHILPRRTLSGVSLRGPFR